MTTRKQKAENSGTAANHKKSKINGSEEDGQNGELEDFEREFEEFSREASDHLSVAQMREILQLNDQNSSGTDGEIITKCQDLLFFGPLENCPYCNNTLIFDGKTYSCDGFYSEWSSCTFKPKSPPRKETAKLPDSVRDSKIGEKLCKQQSSEGRRRQSAAPVRPFSGMTISLMGRLSRTHQYWRKQIEKNGGKVSNTVRGVNCLVASPAERERGGSSKLDEAMDGGVRVVRERWLIDSIEKQQQQPLESYDFVSDLVVEGKGIPLDKQDPNEAALETLTAEVKLYGKRGVHKDTKLEDRGGRIFERDGILYNCAFSQCDMGKGINDFCVTQIVEIPDGKAVLYCKKGRVSDGANADERQEEFEKVDEAVSEFVRLFEELTGNEFEKWEREKKIEKKRARFFPIDMGDGFDVRFGGLGLRQLGIASLHSKLNAKVANLMKVLCSQEIYRYALLEMDVDSPELPVGMLSDYHLGKCEETLVEFAAKLKDSDNKEAVWSDFSQRWFTIILSTRPFILRDINELADHGAAVLESIRDVVAASRLVGDMTGATLDDPLADRYLKLGCSISPLDDGNDDYRMIVDFLNRTYEPVVLGDIGYKISVDNIFAVESDAANAVNNLQNKILLWCGTRSSNLVRHLQKGFLPNVCYLPVAGYMFGEAVVCTEAAAEAATYGFTAVDRPEGFLILAVVSVGDDVREIKTVPRETKERIAVKALGRKKTDESQHFFWGNNVRVPRGALVPSDHKDSPFEYNQYAVYDPKQAAIKFLVSVKYEE